jgi:hypothetical protein
MLLRSVSSVTVVIELWDEWPAVISSHTNCVPLYTCYPVGTTSVPHSSSYPTLPPLHVAATRTYRRCTAKFGTARLLAGGLCGYEEVQRCTRTFPSVQNVRSD